MSQKAHDELARSVIQLLLREPFFGHLLGAVVRAVDESTPTASVSLSGARVTLTVNPDFYLKTLRKGPERVAVLKHEALHLLFRHLFRVDRAKHDPLVFNLAADIVVNQFIASPWKLPDDAVTLATFPDLKLEKDKPVEWYYERLRALARELGHCGGTARDDGLVASAPKSAEALKRILGSPRWHSDHDRWGAGDDSEQKVAGTDLDRLVVQARDRAGQRGWGALPNALRELITAAIERRAPKLDWKRALRLFSASARRTRLMGTWQRQSRRYHTIPGIKVKRFQRMAVIVDTSGSISDGDLAEFFAEIHGMWRQGAEVRVIECDAAVQHVFDYRGRLPDKVGGRGGTSFDPAFKYLNDNRRAGVWDGCVYLTDGVAPAPTIRPPCKLLWVVAGNGTVGPHLRWGRAVKLG
ncbi:MAG: VWA-like domain-containing protein [Polyangiales bacterium]